jgi:hypothetical protein
MTTDRPAQYFAGVEALNLYKRAIRDKVSRGNLRRDRPGRHPGSAALETMRLAPAGRRFKDNPDVDHR